MQKLVELLLIAPLDSDPRAVGLAQSRVSQLEHGIKEARTQGLAVHDLKKKLQEAKQELDDLVSSLSAASLAKSPHLSSRRRAIYDL